MRRKAQISLTVLVAAAVQIYMPLMAKEESPPDIGYHAEKLQLSDDDLRDITAQVLAQNPLLSSSPGIKGAGATRHRRSQDIADVIYYPHIETAGIKQAFQVTCSRQVPKESWNCDEARIRRYVALDSQHFEVRVTGPIGSDAAMALIEATRAALPPSLEDGSATPQTAIMILPYKDGYLITWGDREGHAKLTMQARLPDGADPREPTGWQAKVYSPDN